MIAFLKAFASLRNVAILAGVLFTVYTAHIWLKNQKIDRLELENLRQKVIIENYKDAQTTNIQTIAELQQANQQCAQSRELNEQTAEQELARQQGALADTKEKYNDAIEKLKTMRIGSNDVPVSIGDDIYKLLIEARDDYKD